MKRRDARKRLFHSLTSVAHASLLLCLASFAFFERCVQRRQRPRRSLLLCADKGVCVQEKGAGLGVGIWWKRRRVCVHGMAGLCVFCRKTFPPSRIIGCFFFRAASYQQSPRKRAQTTYIILNLARYRLLVRSVPPSRSLIPIGHALSVKVGRLYNVQEKKRNGQALSALSMRSNKSFSFFSFWLLLISTKILNTLTLCQFSN